MSIYVTNIPSNVEIYMQELRFMIKFEILKPDNILALFDSELTLKKIVKGQTEQMKGNFENTGYEMDNILINMSVYILIFVVFLLGILVLTLL